MTVDLIHATLFMGDNSKDWLGFIGTGVLATIQNAFPISYQSSQVTSSREPPCRWAIACAVENDPNQTLQATVGSAFFLMFFGGSAGFGFSMS